MLHSKSLLPDIQTNIVNHCEDGVIKPFWIVPPGHTITDIIVQGEPSEAVGSMSPATFGIDESSIFAAYHKKRNEIEQKILRQEGYHNGKSLRIQDIRIQDKVNAAKSQLILTLQQRDFLNWNGPTGTPDHIKSMVDAATSSEAMPSLSERLNYCGVVSILLATADGKYILGDCKGGVGKVADYDFIGGVLDIPKEMSYEKHFNSQDGSTKFKLLEHVIYNELREETGLTSKNIDPKHVFLGALETTFARHGFVFLVRARLTGDEICRAYEEQRDAYIEAGKPKDARWKPEFNKLVACDSQECVDILTSCGGKYAFVAQDPAAQKAMQEFVK